MLSDSNPVQDRYISTVCAIPRQSPEQQLELLRRWHSEGDERDREELFCATLRFSVVLVPISRTR
jgi:hypothetical protein